MSKSHYKEKRFLFTKNEKGCDLDYFLCLNRSGKLWINVYMVGHWENERAKKEGKVRNPYDSSHYAAYKTFEVSPDMVEALADSMVLIKSFYDKKIKSIL